MSRAIWSIRARIASVRCTEARVRQLDVDEQIALILRGDEAGRRARHPPPGQPEQAAVDHQHDHAEAQQLPDRPAVGGGDAVEDAVETPEEPAQHGVDGADEEPAGHETNQQAGAERGTPVQPFLQRARLLGRGRRQAQVAGQEARRQPGGEQPADDSEDPPGEGFFFRVAPSAFPAWPAPASSLLKMETAREGVSVMALTAEMITEAAMVRANWR